LEICLFYSVILVWLKLSLLPNGERERERSTEQVVSLMYKHDVWTLCAWMNWDNSAEKMWNLWLLFGFWDMTSLEAEIPGWEKGKSVGQKIGNRRPSTFSLP
jgi:hypothetical protein